MKSLLAALTILSMVVVSHACDVFASSAVNCQVAASNFKVSVANTGYNAVALVPSVTYAEPVVQAVVQPTVVPVAVNNVSYGVATILSAQPVIHTQTFGVQTYGVHNFNSVQTYNVGVRRLNGNSHGHNFGNDIVVRSNGTVVKLDNGNNRHHFNNNNNNSVFVRSNGTVVKANGNGTVVKAPGVRVRTK